MKKWEVISQNTIYKTKLFDVKEEEIILPNGHKRTYSVVERRPVAVIFPLVDYSLKLYLISQYRYLFEKNILEAVAGHIDKKESPLEAAKRELKEEAGISAQQWEEMIRIENSASVIKSTVHLFVARGLYEGKPNPEEGEEIKVVKMPLEEAVSKVLLGEINNSSTVIGILLLDKMRREGTLS